MDALIQRKNASYCGCAVVAKNAWEKLGIKAEIFDFEGNTLLPL